MEETAEEIEPAIGFPNLFPEVVSAVAAGILGVARAALVALVEGKGNWWPRLPGGWSCSIRR